MTRSKGTCTSLVAARWRLSGAIGAASRMLWRRTDLLPQDETVLDLLSEALVRLGELLRPIGRELAADLDGAPPHVRALLDRFLPLARSDLQPANPQAKSAPATDKREHKGVVLNVDATPFVPNQRFVFRAAAPEFVPEVLFASLAEVDQPSDGDDVVSLAPPSPDERSHDLDDLCDTEAKLLNGDMADSCLNSMVPSLKHTTIAVEGAWRWPSAAQRKAEATASMHLSTRSKPKKKGKGKKKASTAHVSVDDDLFLDEAVLAAEAQRMALAHKATPLLGKLQQAISGKGFVCPPCGGQVSPKASFAALDYAEVCAPCNTRLSTLQAAAVCEQCRVAFCLSCVTTFEGFA